jgi:hypothetical protein
VFDNVNWLNLTAITFLRSLIFVSNNLRMYIPVHTKSQACQTIKKTNRKVLHLCVLVQVFHNLGTEIEHLKYGVSWQRVRDTGDRVSDKKPLKAALELAVRGQERSPGLVGEDSMG